MRERQAFRDGGSKSDWWRRLLPACIAAVLPLDKVVAEIKLLKARVEDVSHRCSHYGLTGIIDFGSKPVVQQQPAPNAALSVTAVDTTGVAHPGLGDLTQLIVKDVRELEVISVWGRSDDVGALSVIRKAYEDPEVRQIYGCRGWVKLEYPFDLRNFLQSMVAQFYINSCLQQGKCVDVVELEGMMGRLIEQGGFVEEFKARVNQKRFLPVLENLHNMGHWDAIKACIPECYNGALVIVYTQEREIAKLCIGRSDQVLELKQDNSGYPVRVFFKQGSHGEIDRARMFTDVIHDVNNRVYTRIHTTKRDEARCWMEEFTLIGREEEMKYLLSCQTEARFNDWQVMSVWGITGVGKSALVRNFYYDNMCESADPLFHKYTWVNVVHPLNLKDFSRILLSEFFNSEYLEHTETKSPIQKCRELLKECPCLLVIDDIQSMEEWDLIQNSLVSRHSKSLIIVITTQENIAAYCADSEVMILNVRNLEDGAAFHLFKKEVWRRNPSSYLLRQNDMELRELILKCGGLPEVIISVAESLATESLTTMNYQFMNKLQRDPEFGGLQGLFRWLDSYIGTCPDFLKQCIVYLSIFSQYRSIRRRRILRRWIAEGYIKDSEIGYAEERGEWCFSELLGLCIIQLPPHSVSSIMSYTRTVLFQINMVVGQYILSGPQEENLFLELEKSSIIAPHRIGRHIIIRENWVRDRTVFKSIDFLRLRSLTVFGGWESFFISESMKVLRVLDLEDSTGVTDKDLEKIVNLLSRLKYLSLRGCREICRLPHGLGDLRQLETLDVRHTSVDTIPGTIINLNKLQYLRVGMAIQTIDCSTRHSISVTQLPQFSRYRPLGGIKLPEGVNRLTLLSTLGVISISAAATKPILKGLRNLIRLRKLGVTGVNKKNYKEVIEAISCHFHLESLSLWLSKDDQYSSEDIFSPPENLRTLKLYGLVNFVPSWIKDIHKLAKLELEMTISNKWMEESGIIGVLGDIKELTVLRLYVKPLQDGDTKLDFCVWLDGIQKPCYLRVKILEIACNSNLNLVFGSHSMQNLELLTVRSSSDSALEFWELKSLSKLKEVQLIGAQDRILEDLRTELNNHPRRPVLKSEEASSS